jgi:hypothetical protein
VTVTIFGSDISHYDGSDTRAMFAEGIVFQTHKAGGDKNDAELASWWGYVRGYRDRVMLGAYWVLYPGSPASRAEQFLARLDSQCPGWRDGPFILQADCERWNGDPTTVPSVAEVNAFCDRLVDRAPRLRPIGYLPDWVYGDLSGFRYPLWSSKYVAGSGSFKSLYPGDNSAKWAAYGGKSPSVLQYSSSATIGGQTTCDANAYRGTLAELTQLLAPGWIKKVDDVSEQDAYNGTMRALRDFHDVQQDGETGDMPESVIGHNASVQRVPAAPFAGKNGQLMAYQYMGQIGTNVMLLRNDVAALAGKDFVDEAAIVKGMLAGVAAAADNAASAIADMVLDGLPAGLANNIARQILAKQGQAMVDAADDVE